MARVVDVARVPGVPSCDIQHHSSPHGAGTSEKPFSSNPHQHVHIAPLPRLLSTAERPDLPGGASAGKSVGNIVISFVGAGMLSLPFAFQQVRAGARASGRLFAACAGGGCLPVAAALLCFSLSHPCTAAAPHWLLLFLASRWTDRGAARQRSVYVRGGAVRM